MGKISETIDKVKKLRKSPIGQKIEKAAVKNGVSFLKESGLGKMGADKLNDVASKYTSGNVPLDVVRKIAHASATNYFQEKEPLPTTEPTIVVNQTNPPRVKATPSYRSARSEHVRQR